MKKNLVSFFLYLFSGFLLLPLPTLAGSCYCDQYSQAMGVRKSCDSGTPGVIQPDASYCQNKNGKTESDGQNSFTYSNCVYFDSTNCQAVTSGEVQQTATKSTPVKITPPKLEVNIPGLNFSSLSNDSVDGQGNIHIPFLGQYISAIYKLAMTVGSLLAVIMIILNGFRIVISAGGDQKKVGIQNITKSLTGLFILWSSYALLYTINPALTQFKPLGVHYIVPFDYTTVDQNITAASSVAGQAKTCSYDEKYLIEDYGNNLVDAAKAANIDPLILAAIFQKENNGSGVASRGSCGEVGVTQLMPGTVDMLSGTMNCCTASTRSGSCAETKTRDQIGRDGGGDPYSFSCASVCGTCMQASRSCVDYFHDEDTGYLHSMQFSALLIKKLYDRAKGDIALTFAAYNGGKVTNVSSQAAAYAQGAVQIYNGLCQSYAVQQ